MQELTFIEKRENKYQLDKFEDLKTELEDYCRSFQEIKDKETLKIAKGIKADYTKKIKMLKDTLKAYKNDYFEILDNQIKELTEIIEVAEQKQKAEIDAFGESKATDKYNALANAYNELNINYSLDDVLKALGIDLKLEKWTFETALETIKNAHLHLQYHITLDLSESELLDLAPFIAQIEASGVVVNTKETLLGE